nr:hypothetical protein [Candidatus Omnitrophota bacterium]
YANGTSVRNTTVYAYRSNDPDLIQSTYIVKGDHHTDYSNTGVSKTYTSYSEYGGIFPGDEQVTRSLSFKPDTVYTSLPTGIDMSRNTQSTTFYNYDGLTLSSTDTYRVYVADLAPADRPAQYLSSRTSYVGESKEEIVNYTISYKNDGWTITSTAYQYYEHVDPVTSSATIVDALHASTEDRLFKSVSTKAFKVNETYYKNEKGYEVADYAYLRTSAVGNQILSRTDYYYGPSYLRAGTFYNVDDVAMTRSDMYKYSAGGTPSFMSSRTFYKGEKGAELADYAYNYYSDSTIRNTTYYDYEDAIPGTYYSRSYMPGSYDPWSIQGDDAVATDCYVNYDDDWRDYAYLVFAIDFGDGSGNTVSMEAKNYAPSITVGSPEFNINVYDLGTTDNPNNATWSHRIGGIDISGLGDEYHTGSMTLASGQTFATKGITGV